MSRHLKWEEEKETNEPSSNSNTPPSYSSSMAVGLRMILTRQTELPSNVVVKCNKLSTQGNPTANRPVSDSLGDFTCYLQSCQRCRKKLCPGKDVYMYRGDQGFCSEECRERQILMDETRELEASTKRILASSRHCYASGPKSETRLLLEELWQRRNQTPVRKTRAIIS